MQHLRPGYVVVLCAEPGCHATLSDETAETLRACVRSSHHGVLVMAGCLDGPMSCRLRPPGQMLVIQPCDADRTPRGIAVSIGPVATDDDLAAVRTSLTDGRFDPTVLPARLLAGNRRARTAARN